VGASEDARDGVGPRWRSIGVRRRSSQRYNRPQAAPRKDRINLNEAISELIGLARSAIAENGVSVQTHFREGLGLIKADRVQLQQVALNLILNAIEAMRSIDGGARELLISTEPRGTGGVVVAVRDSGLGIDPEFRERVFDAFYTTKSSGV
jgi:signal transduction histidine kinase